MLSSIYFHNFKLSLVFLEALIPVEGGSNFFPDLFNFYVLLVRVEESIFSLFSIFVFGKLVVHATRPFG